MPPERAATPAAHAAPGLLMGLGAYSIWGLFPAFFPLLAPAGPTEILAHRMVWTLVLMLGVLVLTGRLHTLRGLPPRTWAMAGAAAVLISVNWGVYIYAVNSGKVVEAALGYFINPLVSVLLAVLVLRERLRRWQLVALGVAAVAVAALTIDYGRPPWLALTLAASFGLYGLIKKTVPLDPRASLTAEGLVVVPFALAWLVWLQVQGAGTAISLGTGHTLLLLAAGPLTAVPLLLFGGAAQRVPLATLGLLQYLTPVLQFIWGVAVVHENMPSSRWLGFGLVWAALVVFTVDAVRNARSSRRAAGLAHAVRATV
jgi:chloramphenicol-sensitive protein RarD